MLPYGGGLDFSPVFETEDSGWAVRRGRTERQSFLPRSVSKICWCVLEDFCNEIKRLVWRVPWLLPLSA